MCWAAGRGSWGLCRLLGAQLGLVKFAAQRPHYEEGISHLRRAFPHWSKNAARCIMRRTVQNSAMCFFETARLRTASTQEVRDYAQINGLENYETQRDRGHGVILAAAHFGNLEMGGVRLAQEMALTAISLPVGCPKTQQMLEEMRRNAGIYVLHPTRSARTIIDALSRGEAVALFGDHNSRQKDLTVPFFGYPRHVISSPAHLSYLTGAALIPHFAVRRTPWLSDGSFDIQLRPALLATSANARQTHIVEKTLGFHTELENLLRLCPDQWYGWNLLRHSWQIESSHLSQS
ncbi:MAG: lysophospholipid acyltransferase family protein [Armatimonadetes bacterium]|nr:lysophospholipid acyltransferase family protein [Armatimonadota bacterium]